LLLLQWFNNFIMHQILMYKIHPVLQSRHFIFQKRFLLITIIVSIHCICVAQSQTLKYKVVQNNNVIGWLKLEKRDSVNTSVITFSSEIKKRFLLLFTIIETQEVFFQNGVMMHSHVYRKVNSDVKVNKRTTYAGNHYEVTKGKSSTQVNLGNITYNQLSLYFFEPVNIKQVYSDNYERYLKIEKTGTEFYTMELPEGNKNYYYYKNGICSKVKVEQSLFTVEFLLSD
jgi:hypothetical protein